jgi:hypothetical protein
LALNTDHIVPVREIRDNVVKSGLLELYEKASPAVKAEIEKSLQDLGDERDNLTRMESEANQTTKKDRLWTDIKDDEVASLYTAEMAAAMRAKEGKLKEHYKKVIQALVTRFSK